MLMFMLICTPNRFVVIFIVAVNCLVVEEILCIWRGGFLRFLVSLLYAWHVNFSHKTNKLFFLSYIVHIADDSWLNLRSW